MIEFECESCGEPMEIGDRMAGKKVQCVECEEMVRVPMRGDRRPRRRQPDDEGLSQQQLLLFALLFLFVPFVIVILSSVLYYVWKNQYPRRANQINLLGFIIFGIHVGLLVLYYVLLK